MAREIVVSKELLVGRLAGSDGERGKWGRIVVEKHPTKASTCPGDRRRDCISDILSSNQSTGPRAGETKARGLDLHMSYL